MKITRWDLMKLSQSFDDEFILGEFTDEEIYELLGLNDDMTIDEVKERYFEYYDDIKDKSQKKHKWSD
ncbi:MAG: hypothetical protein LUE27_11795 [Clostridia bacterium]|nr:hypothetical protein [Clostridia bacterium]